MDILVRLLAAMAYNLGVRVNGAPFLESCKRPLTRSRSSSVRIPSYDACCLWEKSSVLHSLRSFRQYGPSWAPTMLPELNAQNKVFWRDKKSTSFVWNTSLATATVDTTRHGWAPTSRKRISVKPMDGENRRQPVADEPDEFEMWPVEAQDVRRTPHFVEEFKRVNTSN